MSGAYSESLIEWTDYAIKTPEWFLEYLSEHLNKRDIRGLSSDTIEAIAVRGEHPLVMATGAILSAASSGTSYNVASILPSIAVVESDEDEVIQTMGRGLRKFGSVDLSYFQAIQAQYPDQGARQTEGLLTDAQIATVEDYINVLAAEQNKDPATIKLVVKVNHYWLPSAVYISLWTNTLQERSIIGAALRSVIFDMKGPLADRNVRDISIRTSKGLVNMNFGRILHGQETEFRFNNWFRTFSVLKEMSLDGSLSVITELNFETLDPPRDPITRFETESGDWEPAQE